MAGSMRSVSVSAGLFVALCDRVGIPEPRMEYRFARPRMWRMDFAWVDAKLALEVEGGVWTGGRHTRGSGFLRDIEKYNRAAAMGWRLLRVTPDKLSDLGTVRLVGEALGIHVGEIGQL